MAAKISKTTSGASDRDAVREMSPWAVAFAILDITRKSSSVPVQITTYGN